MDELAEFLEFMQKKNIDKFFGNPEEFKISLGFEPRTFQLVLKLFSLASDQLNQIQTQICKPNSS